MSVLIKGMEMPEACCDCFVPCGLLCGLLPLGFPKLDEYYEQRLDNCPLVEVIEVHNKTFNKVYWEKKDECNC